MKLVVIVLIAVMLASTCAQLTKKKFVPKVVSKLMPLTHSSSREGKDITHIVLHFSSLCVLNPE